MGEDYAKPLQNDGFVGAGHEVIQYIYARRQEGHPFGVTWHSSVICFPDRLFTGQGRLHT